MHRHRDWHRGHWKFRARRFAGLPHRHDFWYRRWHDRPFFWGLSAWYLGPWVYTSGYYQYYNPYCVDAGFVNTLPYDYTRPIIVASGVNVYDDDSSEQNPATADLNAARQAFLLGRYEEALRRVDEAIRLSPDDVVLHEFRALVLFAMQDYAEAAAVIHSVLAVGPGWDWPTLRSLYPDKETYTRHLRALERYRRENPDSAGAYFLLAYHYMTCEHPDAAADELRRVVQLQPRDRVAAELLKTLEQDSSEQPEVGGPQVVEIAPEPPAGTTSGDLQADVLQGTWKAAPEEGATVTLTLEENKKFQWRFEGPDEESHSFSGEYSLAGNVLVLERNDGNVLVGRVSGGEGAFNFRLVDAPPDDPGLDFRKPDDAGHSAE